MKFMFQCRLAPAVLVTAPSFSVRNPLRAQAQFYPISGPHY